MLQIFKDNKAGILSEYELKNFNTFFKREADNKDNYDIVSVKLDDDSVQFVLAVGLLNDLLVEYDTTYDKLNINNNKLGAFGSGIYGEFLDYVNPILDDLHGLIRDYNSLYKRFNMTGDDEKLLIVKGERGTSYAIIKSDNKEEVIKAIGKLNNDENYVTEFTESFEYFSDNEHYGYGNYKDVAANMKVIYDVVDVKVVL